MVTNIAFGSTLAPRSWHHLDGNPGAGGLVKGIHVFTHHLDHRRCAAQLYSTGTGYNLARYHRLGGGG